MKTKLIFLFVILGLAMISFVVTSIIIDKTPNEIIIPECFEKSFDQTYLGMESEYEEDILVKLNIDKGCVKNGN